MRSTTWRCTHWKNALVFGFLCSSASHPPPPWGFSISHLCPKTSDHQSSKAPPLREPPPFPALQLRSPSQRAIPFRGRKWETCYKVEAPLPAEEQQLPLIHGPPGDCNMRDARWRRYNVMVLELASARNLARIRRCRPKLPLEKNIQHLQLHRSPRAPPAHRWLPLVRRPRCSPEPHWRWVVMRLRWLLRVESWWISRCLLGRVSSATLATRTITRPPSPPAETGLALPTTHPQRSEMLYHPPGCSLELPATPGLSNDLC